MDSKNALRLTSTIVSYFLDKNQKHFTSGNGKLTKTVFVVEEAQSVLGSKSENTTFIELAKEGRKYSLGSLFITQQPGSIPHEILSQSDNFFVFHLLSKGDLTALSNANAHYSSDTLTQIISEPVMGKAYMWTSNQPFTLPVMILDFNELATASSSNTVQKEKSILAEIISTISDNDKILDDIIEKYKDIVKDTKIVNNQTIGLYRNLSDEEKQYCRDNSFMAINGETGDEFGVNYNFIKKLKDFVPNHPDEDEAADKDDEEVPSSTSEDW